jgi:hypothetical protein
MSTEIFGAFVLVLSGVAAWNVISTLAFDISIIRGKRPWRWPMVNSFSISLSFLIKVLTGALLCLSHLHALTHFRHRCQPERYQRNSMPAGYLDLEGYVNAAFSRSVP